MPQEWIALPDPWMSVIRVAITVVMAGVVVRLGDKIIMRAMSRPDRAERTRIPDNRQKTLASLLKSILRYATGAVVAITLLELVGIDTSAVLGGAAILGVAVGFGAQNLVRDVITGFFIIYEGQYDIGDYITAAGLSGTVEEVGLRTTRLRDWNGDVHVVPNGLIDKTTNKSRAGSRVMFDVTIDHDADARKAIEVMQSVCNEVAREYPIIIEGPTVLGVTNLSLAGVVIQVWARTKPLEQYALERDLKLRIKEALQAAGIPLAHLPQTTLPAKDS